MSFTSSLPANLPKYGLPTTWDFAKGRERYLRVIYVGDESVGADRYMPMLSSTDLAVGLETFVSRHVPVLLSADLATGLETFVRTILQRDRANALERLTKKTYVRDLSRGVEKSFIRLFGADGSRGAEPGFVLLAPKYVNQQTGTTTTTPTQQSVFIGVGGVGGCVAVGNISLCYKKLGDLLDYETLQNILNALKQSDDKVREWANIIEQDLLATL